MTTPTPNTQSTFHSLTNANNPVNRVKHSLSNRLDSLPESLSENILVAKSSEEVKLLLKQDTEGSMLVILEFVASWCGLCAKVNPQVEVNIYSKRSQCGISTHFGTHDKQLRLNHEICLAAVKQSLTNYFDNYSISPILIFAKISYVPKINNLPHCA